MRWPKSLLRFSCKMLCKNLNKLFGQSNTNNWLLCTNDGVVVCVQSLSHVQPSETPWTRLLCPWKFSKQEYRSGFPFPLIPTQGSNLQSYFSCVSRWILLPLSHLGVVDMVPIRFPNGPHLLPTYFLYLPLCSLATWCPLKPVPRS